MISLAISWFREHRTVFVRLSMMTLLVLGRLQSIGFVSSAVANPPGAILPASHRQSLQLGSLAAEGTLPAGESGPEAEPSDASQIVQFAQLPARVGDRVGQEIRVELNLNTTIMQSDQIANQSRHLIHRRQDRGIEILEVIEGRAHRAHVTYLTCRQTRQEVQPDQESAEAQAVSQPVEGKSYFVTRQGQQLLITDPEGNIPPLDQYQIVLENMQTLGQPNPLARFLLGRRFTLGERIVLPQSLAEQLLGLSEPFGKVQSFELELVGSEKIDGQWCALFHASIDAMAREQGEIGLNITGRLAIQMATCRTIAAELAGPVQMAVKEKTKYGSFQYRATGDMRLSIHSMYASVEP